jgi:hypothetical protein
MTEYEIYLYAEKIIRLHKVSNPFSWYRLSAMRDLHVTKFDLVSDGKVIREELLNKGIITQTYPSDPLNTSLTLYGNTFDGYLFPSDAEQESRYPKVLRSYTYHHQQDFSIADFEEVILNPTQEQSFKEKHAGKEIRSFSKYKPPMAFDIPDFKPQPVVQHFHKTEYHVAESNAQFFQESTISGSQIKQENKVFDDKPKFTPWYLTWQFKYIIWPLVVLLIAMAIELYLKSNGVPEK